MHRVSFTYVTYVAPSIASIVPRARLVTVVRSDPNVRLALRACQRSPKHDWLFKYLADHNAIRGRCASIEESPPTMKLSPLAHQANAHDDAVWSVAWSGAGEGLLLTGSVDESVKAWRAAGDGLEMAHAYTGHTLGVVALAAAPNGLVASSALDSLIRVWSVDTHETRCVIETPPAENWQIAFAPGDEPAHLAVAGGVSGGVKLYSIEQDGGEQVSVMSLPEVAADKAKNSRFVQVSKQDPDQPTHHIIPRKDPCFRAIYFQSRVSRRPL